MTIVEEPGNQPSTLPELEQLLLHTAQRRVSRRFGGRRWVLGVAAGSLVFAGGAVAAATGVLHLAEGQTSQGTTYKIDRQTSATPSTPAEPGRVGSICLQLQYRGGGPAYGCGARPTPAQPFGLVIADSLNASADRVVYGLVANNVTRVSVLGDGDSHTDAETTEKPGLPGRFFSATVPNHGRIELVGYDASGNERARIGSRAQQGQQPQSHDQAIAQGDPAGFAPAIAPPSSFTYDHHTISPTDAARRGLTCAQDRAGVQCYDSLAALDAAQRKRH